MKANQNEAGASMDAKVNAIEAAIATLFGASESVYCYGTLEEKTLVFQANMDLAKLPWSDADFVRKLVQIGFKNCLYRSPTARKEAGFEPGEISEETFAKGILATTFLGEPAPSKEDKDKAEKLFRAIEAGIHTWDDADAAAKAAGRELKSHTKEGLVNYFFAKRREIEAQAKTPMDLM